MMEDLPLMLAVFGVAGSVFLFAAVGLLSGNRANQVERRVKDTSAGLRSGGSAGAASRSGGSMKDTIPKLGKLLMPSNSSRQERLRDRLLQAGLYQRHSTAVYLGFKFVLMVIPAIAGAILGLFGTLPLTNAIGYGAAIGLVGTVLPSFWLDAKKRSRQKQLRRAMPDALDVIVICMEGGLSLSASMERVSKELRSAHPLLAAEMAIARQEMTLGMPTGEALKNLATRFDVEELRSLASVVTQAERYGASIVKALKVHADTLRLKRYQWAEAMAQKAPLKIVFPTALCIFPVLYLVLVGPAFILIYTQLFPR